MQTQIDSLSSGGSGDPGGGGDEIGTMWFNKKVKLLLIYYIYICGCEYLYVVIKPCPKLHVSKHPPPRPINIKIAYKNELGVSLTETRGFEDLLKTFFFDFWVCQLCI